MQAPTDNPRAFKPALLLILLLPAALFLAPLSIVVGAAMIPTLVARLVDTGRPAFLSITVGCANLVGSLYFVDVLLSLGMQIENIGVVLRDPIGWLAAFGAAGVGWALFLCFPIVVQAMAQGQTAMRLRRMRRDQQRLIDDWGSEVGEDKSRS
jgi:hypothetical protein